MTTSRFRLSFGDFTGAFADAAVLLPLVAAVGHNTGASGAAWIATAGIAYLVAGFLFRVPMSVQPLKSIAIASLALGASSLEIRVAGFSLGAILAIVAFFPRIEALSRLIPESIVQSVQFGLGILLISQGVRAALPLATPDLLLAAAAAGLALALPAVTTLPALGILATGGVLYGAWVGHESAATVAAAPSDLLRPPLLLALLLPQIALTSANSVLGTRLAAVRYFGEAAGRVTVRRLLLSIGAGNLAAALFAGMPFCHGSGGITAHVRGGARNWSMNVVAGTAFLALAALSSARGGPSLPPFLVASLLAVIGIHHLGLARPTLASRFGRVQLAAGAAAVLATGNLLYCLASVVFLELARARASEGDPKSRDRNVA